MGCIEVWEPESFVAKVRAIAEDRYPDGVLPELPPWFPVDVLEGLSPATELLVRMTSFDLSDRSVPPPLWQVGWALNLPRDRAPRSRGPGQRPDRARLDCPNYWEDLHW